MSKKQISKKVILQFSEVKYGAETKERQAAERSAKDAASKKATDWPECAAANDETLRWIASQPELLAYLFDLCARIGYITCDPEMGEWRGVDV